MVFGLGLGLARACWPRGVQPLLWISVVVSALGPGESWLGSGLGLGLGLGFG